MKLTIFRGSNEVGGNCVEIEAGKTRIILDVGMPLFDNARRPHDGFSLGRMTTNELHAKGILPKVQGLFSGCETPDAILLSHAHLDHVGLLKHTQPSIPVYASRGTSKMMLAGGVYANQQELPRDRFREIKAREPIGIGELTVTGLPVDHSIHGCLAFLIESDDKRILYTGDLRLHGRRQEEHRRIIAELGDTGLDALIVEGTHFGFDNGNEVSEGGLAEEIADHVAAAQGLVLASFSPQNVDRLNSFIRAANRSGRTFVVDAYTAFVLHLVSAEAELENPLRSGNGRLYLPDSLKQKIERKGTNRANELFRDAEISLSEILDSPGDFMMVFRPSMLADFAGKLPPNTLCLYSTWHGYSEGTDWQDVLKSLDAAGGELVHVHTSGHALSTDIVEFTRSINAERIIPIHSFEPEQFNSHFDNVTLSEDGVPIEL
ncbi:MBL fold metallo-hydrolase [Roseimaritima sediminicola]|uniref:MBL fold metallo-hydrolase n=1 Tax=Roseimaritima sediminicola TaxID=2662066 RepID=UPI0012983CE4|nr:MBL fold metallo-hydrolase [Roseimaritima sediminicola]